MMFEDTDEGGSGEDDCSAMTNCSRESGCDFSSLAPHRQKFEKNKPSMREFIRNSIALKHMTDNFMHGTSSTIEMMGHIMTGSREQILGFEESDSVGFHSVLRDWFNYYIGMLDELKMVNHGVILRCYHFYEQEDALRDAARERREQREVEQSNVSSDEDEDMAGDFTDLSIGDRHKDRCLYHKRKPFVPPLAVNQYNQGPSVRVVDYSVIKSCRYVVSKFIDENTLPPGKKEVVQAAIDCVACCDEIIGNQFVLMAAAMHEFEHIANQVDFVGCCFLEMSNEPYNERISFLMNGSMYVCEGYIYRTHTCDLTFATKLGFVEIMSHTSAFRLADKAKELELFNILKYDDDW